MKVKNLFVPIVMIILSVIVLFLTSQFPTPLYQDSSISSSFFPNAVAVLQIIICLALIVGECLKGKVQSNQGAGFNKYSLFGAVFIVSYAVAIYLFGYLISTLLAFLVYLFFFRSKNVWYYVTALVFTSVVYYVFTNVFYVVLPEGTITG
ncbi:tripartite tricarboxylate transporter TctB family protein [Marinomonas sp. C2222]|uniref:Tripartite tricarboxylate transporter TctB family protein n=1 Tax=Marinomonas sargassi TaxID=2984494 RepID=A0ABT2YQ19_9GAMM|nr:tripartite tricarboxylate transporter TctB family protein [Marinomonas sargassi]MCV2401976.1 tripartite tricarboxylate transporter TctB family protein [Marinomonas sargassi]